MDIELFERVVERFGGRQRMMLAAVGVGAIAVILGISWFATRPAWVPVFADLPLSAVGKLSDKLTEAGIKYHLDASGTTILVPDQDVARARVALAREKMPNTGRPGLELFDQPSWGMTDFTQRINYRRALEGELERTIGRIRDVESAEVHLALNETSSFRQADKPGRASVIIKLREGVPSAAIVQGIAQLVASSVGSMASDDVMVIDDSGRLLSIPNDGGATSLTSRQLSIQREIEGYMKQKVEQIVADVAGMSDARVQVSAQVNFDHVERTSQLVDPDKQATTSEQKAEITPGTQGGAGSSNSSMNYENSRTIENFTGATGTVKRLSVAVLLNGDSSSAAKAPSAAQVASLRQLIGAAVGADPTRGDVISVESVPFRQRIVAPQTPTTTLDLIRTNARPALLVFGLVLAFIIALRAIKSLRPQPYPLAAELALPSGESIPVEAALHSGDEAHRPESPFPAFSPYVDPMREQVLSIVQQKPELAVRLVRSWLREG